MEQAGYSSSQVDLAGDRIAVRRAPYRRYEKPMTAHRAVATASRTRHARHYNCLEFMHRKRLVSWNCRFCDSTGVGVRSGKAAGHDYPIKTARKFDPRPALGAK
jgi:hypothetical protein